MSPPNSVTAGSMGLRRPLRPPMDEGEVLPHVYDRLAQDRRRNGIAWWPLGASYLADPYPDLRRLRETAPCLRCSLTGGVLVTRYREVDRVLRDYEAFSLKPAHQRRNRPAAIHSSDPPEHTRLRRFARRAFTPQRMTQMEDYTRATAHKLLDRVADQDVFDWVSVLAHPLPVLVIGRMVGLPKTTMELFKEAVQSRYQSDDYTRQMGWLREPTPSKERLLPWLRANALLRRRLARLVEERRSEPRDDVVSSLVDADSQGDRLTHQEAEGLLRIVLTVGEGKTGALIGTGLLALLRHPEHMRLLRERPELLADAVEELLRYDAPAHLVSRLSVEDTEIAGVPVAAKSLVTLLLGAANRDPDRFERPDELDFARTDKRHLAFGRGIHHCLFARLARMEARVAFEVLLERFADVQLASSPPLAFERRAKVRELKHLYIRVRRRT